MRLVAYAGIMLAAVFLIASPKAQAETLAEAVQYALKTNPTVRSLAHNRLARDFEVKQAESGYYPRIDFSAGIGHYRILDPPWTESYPEEIILSLRQNVFTGYATRYETERQRARVRSAAHRLHGTSENTALQTCDVYLNVLQQLELHELALENKLIHERIYDQVKLRSESGIDNRANFEQVKGRLALALSNIITTETNILDAETNYLAIIGHTPEDLTKPESVDFLLPPNLEEAQKTAYENHPTLKSAYSDIEAREAQDKVAFSKFYPIVDIEVDKSWRRDVDRIEGSRDELAAMLRLRYNIFDGFNRDNRKEETLELIKEAQEIRKNTERQVTESIRLSWIAYKAEMEKIAFLQEYVEATTATAEAYNKQWNIGKRTMLDVLDTQAEVINAKKELITAHYNYLYSQYRILNGIGKLVHVLEVNLPAETKLEKRQENASEENTASPGVAEKS